MSNAVLNPNPSTASGGPSGLDGPVGPIWPSPEQRLMLKILLGEDDDARAAWQSWSTQVDIMNLDDGANRLLPMLYSRLRQLQIEHPLRNRIKGIYRHAAYRNRLLAHRAAQLLGVLAGEGIEVILLKGIVLAEQHYDDCADRPMGDVDMLVRRQDAPRAMALLRALDGWQVIEPTPLRDLDALRHAQGYSNGNGFDVDLHWTLLPELGYYPEEMAGFWQRSLSMPFHGQTVRRLGPADQLFHLCAHGVRWNNGSCLRWSVDAMQLLRNEPDLDWQALLKLAERCRYPLLLREALGFLRTELAAPIPAWVSAHLQQVQLPRHAEKQFRSLTGPRGLLGVLRPFWHSYRLHTDGRRDAAGVPSLSRALFSTLGINGYRQLPGLIAGNGWIRLADWFDPRTGLGRSVNDNGARRQPHDAADVS